MVKVRYIGEEDSLGSGKTYAYGREFRCGEVTDVTEGTAKKVARNRFFEMLKDEPEVQSSPIKTDPDCDYDPFEGMTRDDLIALAGEKGVKIDRRWTGNRIAAAIKEIVLNG